MNGKSGPEQPRRCPVQDQRRRPRAAVEVMQLEPRVCLNGPSYLLHGLNFSPYIGVGENPNNGDGQIPDHVLRERFEAIAPFTERIRTFGCNEDLKEAGEYAHALGKEAILGAWIGRDPAVNQAQIDCVVDQALRGHADEILVGSEAMLRRDVTEAELIGYLAQVKERLADGGRGDIPVSTADV